jgi:dimethylhistidine N-methyltransferase
MTVLTPIHHDHRISRAEFASDVYQGLAQPARTISAKYFYDARGSRLFDRICELDEYYPTRTETRIMQRWAAEMADWIGRDARLIEYGSGSSAKTRILLDHLHDPSQYVPVDISGEHLAQSAEALSRDYPLLEVTPVAADFSAQFELPTAPIGTDRDCIYFPGSTIGNFTPDTALALLAKMRDSVGDDGGLLIGFDLQKDKQILEAAYNDREGVTAEFNKNLLHRINRELDADFDLQGFDHLAYYNAAASRIEMHLVSKREQQATIAGRTFYFGWGETIRTEYSHKYTTEQFTELARCGGWTAEKCWLDEQRYFAVMYLRREN